jgi:hypothetical protein
MMFPRIVFLGNEMSGLDRTRSFVYARRNLINLAAAGRRQRFQVNPFGLLDGMLELVTYDFDVVAGGSEEHLG